MKQFNAREDKVSVLVDMSLPIVVCINSFSFSDLPEFHPIVQMLWDKSRIAARKMAEGDSVKTRSSESNDPLREQKSASHTNTWFQTMSRLERKAQTQKSQGDIAGAIESTKSFWNFGEYTYQKE